MKVRTQLALVFLLFTILPLSALTLYSYYSSSEAFRKLVEEETAGLAQDMRSRMEQVNEDLNRGIERFDHSYVSRMMAAKTEPQGGPDATRLYSSLVSGMGASAGMLDSIEFCPPEAQPGKPSAPPAPPEIAASAPPATETGRSRSPGRSQAVQAKNEASVRARRPDLN